MSSPRAILRDELHAHLHGCVSAEALWEFGKDRWQRLAPRLDWYAAEYEKACGRRPDVARYWREDSGLEHLKADFLMTAAGDFAQFQARFNLLIALLPITPSDDEVLLHVLTEQHKGGVRYGEYRCFVPFFMSDAELFTYFSTLPRAAKRFEDERGGEFAARVIFSLSREESLFTKQYRALRAAISADATVAPYLVGIDFCGDEALFPPRKMAPLVGRIRADNAAHPDTALAILYHVGEAPSGISIASAARWVHEAHMLGAHRLGHALGLGLTETTESPTPSTGATASATKNLDSEEERRSHGQWLTANAHWLAENGCAADQHDDTAALQRAITKDLVRRGAIIECCPTSNLRIAALSSIAAHPLQLFRSAGLRIVVGSDDPGLFATSLQGEEDLCRSTFALDDAAIQSLQATAKRSRAATLSRGHLS